MIEKTSDRLNVIRCADCVFHGIKDYVYGICENRWGLNGIVSPHDYCSKGKTHEQLQQIPKHQNE